MTVTPFSTYLISDGYAYADIACNTKKVKKMRTRKQLDTKVTELEKEIEIQAYLGRITASQVQSYTKEIKSIRQTQVCVLAAIILLALGQILR